MKKITFEIVKWESLDDGITLRVDDVEHMKVKDGELRKIFYEMEKYARLRFKGDKSLNH